MRTGLDAFRDHIRDEFLKQGMGLKSDEEVFETFKTDVDAMRIFCTTRASSWGPLPEASMRQCFPS